VFGEWGEGSGRKALGPFVGDDAAIFDPDDAVGE
jgi:hypothetical protein